MTKKLVQLQDLYDQCQEQMNKMVNSNRPKDEIARDPNFITAYNQQQILEMKIQQEINKMSLNELMSFGDEWSD